MGQDSVLACRNNHGPPMEVTKTHGPSRQQYLPQTPSTLDYCLHKDDIEGGYLKIFPQHLPHRPFSALYYNHLCVAQIRHLDVRSTATQGITGNW